MALPRFLNSPVLTKPRSDLHAAGGWVAFGARVQKMGLKLTPIALILCITQAASGEEGAELNGRWSAGVLQSVWSLANWGDSCGPSPVGGSEAGGIVTLTQTGVEFTIVGLGRSFSSSSCWDQQPGVSPVAHAAGSNQWTTTCRSAPNDPRRVIITSSLVRSGTTLDLDETGRYEVSIAGRQCSASVRRTRHFALVRREGETQLPTSTELDKPSGACVLRGPVARIEVSPTYKLLRLGEQFSFGARLFDEKGCSVAQKILWRLSKPLRGVKVDSNGRLEVASDATEGEVQISAQFGEHSVQVMVYVVSAQRYAELLTSPSFNPAGESDAPSVKAFVPNVLGTRGAQIDSGANRRRTIFIWAVTLLAALLGAAAMLLARRRRHWVPNAQPPDLNPTATTYSESKSPEPVPVRWICPVCGTQYDAASQFCGKDGASLVPIN